MDGGSPMGGSGFSTILSLEIEELGIPASMRPRGRAFASAGDFRFRLATVKQRLESSCPGSELSGGAVAARLADPHPSQIQ
jgi:hypothetical protein